jgi:hypothetical protein
MRPNEAALVYSRDDTSHDGELLLPKWPPLVSSDGNTPDATLAQEQAARESGRLATAARHARRESTGRSHSRTSCTLIMLCRSMSKRCRELAASTNVLDSRYEPFSHSSNTVSRQGCSATSPLREKPRKKA